MENNIIHKIEQSQSFDFGDILSKSFELFKKVWVEGMLHVLVTIGIMLPFFVIVYIPLIAVSINSSHDPYGNNFTAFTEYSPILILAYLILVLIMMFLSQVLAYAVSAHFFRVCKQADTGQPVETGGYFTYLKEVPFGKLLKLSLVVLGISVAAMLLCYLPIFYVMVPLNLIVVILAFNQELSVSEIIKASFKLGNKYWLQLFGLIIVSGIIAQVGVIACGIGVFATASFVNIPMYFVYKETIGFEENSEESL